MNFSAYMLKSHSSIVKTLVKTEGVILCVSQRLEGLKT